MVGVSAILAGGCQGTSPGSTGGVACYTDDECAGMCDGLVEQLAVPGFAHAIVGSRCETIGFGSAPPSPGCECLLEGGGTLVLSSSFPEPCIQYGRDRTCIFRRDEVSGCDLDGGAGCEAQCAELQARLEADAARLVEASVRSSTCADGTCWCVYRIGDGCYVGGDLARYDCALDDASIIEMHRDMSDTPPPCSEAMRSGDETGVCVDDSTSPEDCLHPRDPDEWQGMLVDICLRATCDEPARCGLALACVGGYCGPCAEDSDCATGEACVLDHCVLSDNVACRSSRDCEGDALCILSGSTGGAARGNEDMTAYCNPSGGGIPME